MKRRNIIITILSITLTIIVLIGGSYAYLRQDGKGSDQNITIANFGLVITKDMDAITLPNEVPKKDEEGLKNTPNTFSIENEGDIEANFKLSLIDDELLKSTMSNNNIRYKLKRTRSTTKEEEEYEIRTLRSDGIIDEGLIESGEEISYEIIIWIDYNANPNGLAFRKVLSLEGSQIDIENTIYTKITNAIKEHPGTTIEEDGRTYLSGSNDEVNYNYVWYSGKLWRITSINSDGTIKMITQDELTVINWGANTTYQDSWMYQWLNEDFKDTLYNYQNIIVQNANWNATLDGNSTPEKPKTDASAEIVGGDVGLLNAYEYYLSYKNANDSDGYLNIQYEWWLITPYSDSNVRYVRISGIFSSDPPSSFASGVRPSINLKSNIEVSGEGTKNSPYTIIGDKSIGKKGELISSRLSGEYVKVDNKIYRIVGIETGTTKLTSIDYVRDDKGSVLLKNFGKSKIWGTSITSGDDGYWDYYLNNTWLTNNLKQYITEGTYYLGEYPAAVSYKNTICSESNTSETTKGCVKNSSTWTGLVGLPRVGEMFAAQLGEGYPISKNPDTWLINPAPISNVRRVNPYGNLYSNSPVSFTYAARPSISLKSEIIISGGDGRSPDTAYTIDLPE